MRRRLRTFTFALAMFAPAVNLGGNAFASTDHSAEVTPQQSASLSQVADQTPEQAPRDSQLPLLSILGMGLLTGGLLSALRTRPR